MGWFHRKVPARRAYIQLLRERVDALDSLSEERRRTNLYAELIAGEYLKGVTGTDTGGMPNRNAITGITVKGRLFLQDLESQERERSWLKRATKLSLIVFGFVMGIVSHLLPDLIKSYLTHKP